jgi:hypothetical protein
MRRRKLIGLGLLLAVAIIGVGLLSAPSRPQVVGTLAPDDLTQIMRLVRHDLRSQLFQWRTLLHHPPSVIRCLREYYAQHILWAEVHDDGGVEIFAGASRNVIRDEGQVWSLRKTPEWSIMGYAYWASSNVAPAGIHVPPSP